MVGLFLTIELADLAGAKRQFLSRKLMISFASASSVLADWVMLPTAAL
jgi:hypothetical protein